MYCDVKSHSEESCNNFQTCRTVRDTITVKNVPKMLLFGQNVDFWHSVNQKKNLIFFLMVRKLKQIWGDTVCENYSKNSDFNFQAKIGQFFSRFYLLLHYWVKYSKLQFYDNVFCIKLNSNKKLETHQKFPMQ